MRFFLMIALLLLVLPPNATRAQSPLGLDVVTIPPIVMQSTAAREVTAYIDKSEQRMSVHINGRARYSWPVSTARRGKITPNGTFTAYFLSRNHRSSLYNNAPMPFSIFFHSHYAIHGTDQISRLGSPASAGCIRLHPDNAHVLFDLTREVGLKNMKVVIRD
jgi:lipoprotein-anchoring transpeptidase ErfK/SrfK